MPIGWEFYDRAGKTISYERWSELFNDESYQRVARTRMGVGQVGEVLVSTVWLGQNHRWMGEGPPIIFETMIFGLPGEEYEPCWRCATEEQAREQHEGALQYAQSVLERYAEEDLPDAD